MTETRDPLAPPRSAPAAGPRIGGEHAEPVTADAWRLRVAGDGVATLAVLAEQRWTRPVADRPGRERRIDALGAALSSCGAAAVQAALAQAQRGHAEGRPWDLWPAVRLAATASPGECAARLGALLGADASVADVDVAVDALVAAGAADRALSDALIQDGAPPLRAVGIHLAAREVATARGGLEDEALRAADAPCVVAALRALAASDASAPAMGAARAGIESPDAAVAYEAARALFLWGAPDALERLRAPGLSRVLGTRAADLVVMGGEAHDLQVLERIAHESGLDARLVRAVGRFGHPLAWSLLLHALVEVELAEAALDALVGMFGSIVAASQARVPGAWREAIAELGLADDVRVLNGAPWTVAAAAAELVEERWSGLELAARLDELRARTGAALPLELAARTPRVREALAGARAELARAAPIEAGRWSVRRRR